MENTSLYKKLLSIQQKINGLAKDKQGNNYKYVTGDKLLGFIKPLMNDLGLLLKQEVLSIENTRQDYNVTGKKWETIDGKNTQIEFPKPKSEILSKVMMKFTWIDCETGEKDENLFGANGQNDWEKGLGSALTYAERYFLLKFFHIPTDEDDIDNSDRKESEPTSTDEDEKNKSTSEKSKQPEQWLLVGSKEWKDLLDVVSSGKTITLKYIKSKFKVRPEVVKELETLNIF